ncbi:hypothetical protein FRC07_001586 [Ceratobasidium sp. 392]|nr:hypothetical protein FRC07_001586 [Ceratobasidium sp. 392]
MFYTPDPIRLPRLKQRTDRPSMSTAFIPRSEPQRAFNDDESPVATPTRCETKTAPVAAAPTNNTSYQAMNPMFHLDTDGYPTRALYYLHKKLLETMVNPTSRNFILTTPPHSPLFTPIEVDELEEDPNKFVHLSEQQQVLHHLCATIISRDYIRPPTPPIGASPCHTPPRFSPIVIPPVEHDEAAYRVARLLVQSNTCDVDDLDMLDMLEVELEVELEMGCATPKVVVGDKVHARSCPSTIQRVCEDQDEKENYPVLGGGERNKRTLFEEMEGVVHTPCANPRVNSEERRKEKQARRRARNSLNGTQSIRI